MNAPTQDAPTPEELRDLAESVLYYGLASRLPPVAVKTVCKILGIGSPQEYTKEQARLAVERGKVPY
jgi:hypothetical protein